MIRSDHKLTPEMVASLEKELRAKQEELARVSKSRGGCRPIISGEEGDNELSVIAIQENALRVEIDSIRNTLNTCQVVKLNSSKSVVGIGAIVTIEVTEEGDEPFEMKVSLAKDTNIELDEDIASFTLNSPIGKCIVGQSVGFEGEYIVKGNRGPCLGERKFGCKILAIEY